MLPLHTKLPVLLVSYTV